MRTPNFKRHALAVAISLACVSAHAANTEWVSTVNGQSFPGMNTGPRISGDGKVVAFMSTASGLVNINTQDYLVLVKDLNNGSIKLASVNSQGVRANSHSLDPRISSNGRYVLFESSATNLDPADTDTTNDVYLRDLQTGITKLVSSNVNGQASNADSQDGVISDDGRYAAFASVATNLVATNNNGKRQVYLKDLTTGAIELISKNPAGLAGDNDSFGAVISTDGRYIAFNSIASNLDSQGTANQYDIYIYDRLDKSVQRLGGVKNSHSGNVAMSSDGRIIAFISLASNVVANDTNGVIDVFMLDRKTGDIKRIEGNAQPDGVSMMPRVSGDGRFITFTSSASNLVANDTNGVSDQFVFDRFTNKIELVSVDNNGQQSNGKVDNWSDINKDGSVVAFTTVGVLASGDTNNKLDVYLRRLDPPPSVAPVAKALQPLSQSCDNGGAYVLLDASQSYDPDNQSLTFSWSGPFGTLSGINITPFFTVGNHTVTLTVTDSSGASSSDTVIVSVVDNTAPTVSAGADIILEATAVQGAKYNVAYNAFDSCALNGVSINPTPIYYPLGSTTVTVTATDKVGLSANDQTIITVRDTTAPTLNVPADKVVEANAASMNVDIGVAQASDIFPVTLSNNAPALFPLGQNIVTWIATDANGNKRSAQQKITVQDTIAPSLTLLSGDAVLEATSRAGAEYNAQYSVSDGCIGCGNIDVVMIPALSIYPLGNTLVNISARDSAGNSSSKQFNVKVQDTTAPVLTIPADIVREANDINSTLNIGQASASDIFEVSISNDAPLVYALGNTAITWTATDSNGNRSSAVQQVNITDTTAPLLTVPADLTVEANARLSTVNIGSAIAKDIFGVSISNDAPTGFALGDTVVNWSATDDNGNVSSGKQIVHVVDTTAPVLTAPADVQAEATGPATAVNLGQASASDIFDVSISHDGAAAYTLGEHLVNWTATDSSGNAAHKVQKVRIVDTTAPLVNAGADTIVEATAISGAAFVPSYSASDVCECGQLSYSISPALAMYGLGEHLITVSATDGSGNTGSDSMLLKVVDTTAPVLNLPADILVEATGELTAVNIGQASASDIFPVSIEHNAPASYPLGTTAVTWIATDANGNRSSGVQHITVVDTTAPSFTLNVLHEELWAPNHKMRLAAKVQNIHDLVDGKPVVDIQISSNGNHKRHADQPDWKVVEANGEWLIYLRAEKNHKGEERVYDISVTVSDFSGNSASQSAQVTVNKHHQHDKRDDNKKGQAKAGKDDHRDHKKG